MRPLAERDSGVLTLGAVSRADVPAVCERLRALLDAGGAALVVCDARALRADLVAVEALARLQLTARRAGRRVLVRQASRELAQLVSFCGLADVLPGEAASDG